MIQQNMSHLDDNDSHTKSRITWVYLKRTLKQKNPQIYNMLVVRNSCHPYLLGDRMTDASTYVPVPSR